VYGIITVPKRITVDIPIAVIQPSFPYSGEWRYTHVDEIFDTYYNLSLEASRHAKIIVWPQYNLPIDVYRNPERVARIAKKAKAYIMLGTYLMENEEGYNIALLFSPEGKIIGRYDATHPTPFREGVTSGKDYAVFNTSSGKIAILLCHDDVTPVTASKFVKKDAELLFSLMNNGMFDKTTLPYHHLSRTILRAIENRRFIVRAAASGISAIIDPYGRILKKADVSKRQIIVGKVSLSQEKTFYNRYGSIISYVCLILTLYLTIKTCGKKK
jgi:apolipoprotein N-acyltransferase